jgi:hypothetical protein
MAAEQRQPNQTLLIEIVIMVYTVPYGLPKLALCEINPQNHAKTMIL